MKKNKNNMLRLTETLPAGIVELIKENLFILGYDDAEIEYAISGNLYRLYLYGLTF